MSTVTLNSNAWYVRVYEYVYGSLRGSAKDNFCPFFWKVGLAVLLAPLFYCARFLIGAGKAVIKNTVGVFPKSFERVDIGNTIANFRNSRLGDWIFGDPVAQVQDLIKRADTGDEVALSVLYSMDYWDWRLNSRAKPLVSDYVRNIEDKQKALQAKAWDSGDYDFPSQYSRHTNHILNGKAAYDTIYFKQDLLISIFVVATTLSLLALIFTATGGLAGLILFSQVISLVSLILGVYLGLVFGGPFIGYYVKHVIIEKHCPKITWRN